MSLRSSTESPTSVTSTSSEPHVSITLTHSGKPHVFDLPASSTISDLAAEVESRLSVPLANQKYLLPRELGGLTKHPFPDPDLPLSRFPIEKKIALVGATSADLDQLRHTESGHERRLQALASQRARAVEPRRTRPRTTLEGPTSSSSQYTFLQIRPLSYLPHPERSLAYLTRVANDPAIRHVMAQHKFTVGMLTEMDPAAHTEHARDGSGTTRTLGLNRNAGEVIELRLRTDAGDGYRDYRTVRKTVCHELAHNVFGPHDDKFWELCRRIEREVEKEELRLAGVGGRTVAGEVRSVREYERERAEEEAAWRRKYLGSTVTASDVVRRRREEEEEQRRNEAAGHGDIQDLGGWTGGEFVLGSGNGAGPAADTAGLTRREILARAAEERIRRMNAERRPDQARERGNGQGRP